jgi:stage V sporulation protein B
VSRERAEKNVPDQVTESIGTLTHGIVINIFGTGCNTISRLLYNVVIARLLGPTPLGIYYLALTVANLGGVVAVGGLDMMVVRYLSQYRIDRDWGAFRGTLRFAVGGVAALGLVATLALLALAPWLATTIFNKPEVTTPLRIMSIFVPVSALETVLLAATQSFKEMKYKAYIESILNPTLRILLVVLVFFLGGRLYSIICVHIVSLFICTILSFMALRRCIPVDLKAYQARTDYPDVLRYSFPLLIFHILTYLTLYLDSLVVAHFRSSAEMGLYSVCIRLIIVTSFILPAISHIFGPMISELHHRNEFARLSEYFKLVTLWGVELYIPVVLVFVIATNSILGFFGGEFRAAAPCLFILVIGQLVNNITGPVGLVLNIAGMTRLQSWNAAAVVAVQAVLSVLLVPRFGLLGAALANGVAAVSINLIRVLQVRSRLGMHPFSPALLKPLVAGATALAVAFVFIQSTALAHAPRLGLGSTAMFLVYFGVLSFLGFDPRSRMAWQYFRGFTGQFFALPSKSKS